MDINFEEEYYARLEIEARERTERTRRHFQTMEAMSLAQLEKSDLEAMRDILES